MEDSDLTVDLCQDGAVCFVCAVHETLKCVLRPKTLRNVLNQDLHGCVVLTALRDVEALNDRIEEE